MEYPIRPVDDPDFNERWYERGEEIEALLKSIPGHKLTDDEIRKIQQELEEEAAMESAEVSYDPDNIIARMMFTAATDPIAIQAGYDTDRLMDEVNQQLRYEGIKPFLSDESPASGE